MKTVKSELTPGTDKVVTTGILLSLLLIFLQTLFLLLVYRALPNQIPLFYSRPWGESQLAAKFFIWLLPGLSTFFFLINLVLVKKNAEYQILARILSLLSVANTILFFITQFKIITS